MSQNYMSTKKIDLTANVAVQAYTEFLGRSFLYIRAPSSPAGVRVGIAWGASTATASNFSLEPGEILRFDAPGFVPKQAISVCASADCTLYIASDMPTS